MSGKVAAALSVFAALLSCGVAQFFPPNGPSPPPPPPSAVFTLPNNYKTGLKLDSQEPDLSNVTSKILTGTLNTTVFEKLLVTQGFLFNASTPVQTYIGTTFYAPTDDAIADFAAFYNLTTAELTAAPQSQDISQVVGYHVASVAVDYLGGFYTAAKSSTAPESPVDPSYIFDADAGAQWTDTQPCGAAHNLIKRNQVYFAKDKVALQGGGGVSLLKFKYPNTAPDVSTSLDGLDIWRFFYKINTVLQPCAIPWNSLNESSGPLPAILFNSSLPAATTEFLSKFLEVAGGLLAKYNSSTILIPYPPSIAAALDALSPKYSNKTALVETLVRAHISVSNATTPVNALGGDVKLNNLLNTTGNASCGTTFTSKASKALSDIQTDSDLYPVLASESSDTVKAVYYNRVSNVSGGRGVASVFVIEKPLVPCNFEKFYEKVQKGCNPCTGSDSMGFKLQLQGVLISLGVLVAWIMS